MKLIDILVEELPKRGGWPEGVVAITQDSDKAINNYKTVDGLETNENGTWRYSSAWEGFSLLASDAPFLASDYDTAIITREQYEAALAAKKEGWIEWGGGECPVEKGTLVDVKLRCGSVTRQRSGESLDWQHDGKYELGAIIAYRLHQPQQVAQTDAEQEVDLNECIGQAPVTTWSGEGLPPVGCECEAKFRHRNSAEWMYFRCVAVDCDVAFGWAGKDAVALEWESYQFRPIRSEEERKREEAAQALCDAGGGNGKVDEKAGYGSCWFDVYDAIAAGKIPGVKLED